MAGEIKIEKPNFEKVQPVAAKIEKPLSPEKKAELILPTIEKKVEVVPRPAEKKEVGGFTPISMASDWQKKQFAAIDSILAEGLGEVFLKMKPEEQKAFQKKGEETVTKISELLNAAKVKINKIIDLIRKWLAMVTGINKFFLEQEVKIKADKILHLKDRR